MDHVTIEQGQEQDEQKQDEQLNSEQDEQKQVVNEQDVSQNDDCDEDDSQVCDEQDEQDTDQDYDEVNCDYCGRLGCHESCVADLDQDYDEDDYDEDYDDDCEQDEQVDTKLQQTELFTDYSEQLLLFDQGQFDDLVISELGTKPLWAWLNDKDFDSHHDVDYHKEQGLFTLCVKTFGTNWGGQSNAGCRLATSGQNEDRRGYKFWNKATSETFSVLVNTDGVITSIERNKVERVVSQEELNKVDELVQAVVEEIETEAWEQVFSELDAEAKWAIEAPSSSVYKRVGIETEQQILDRVVVVDLYQLKDNKKLNANKIRQHLIDECGFKFIVLPGDNKVRFYSNGVFIDDYTKLVQKAIAKLLGNSYTASVANTTLSVIKDKDTIGEIASTEFPALHCEWINVSNGMLHIKSEQLVPHDRFYAKFPQVKSVIQLPILYNTEATCSLFDEFLLDKLDGCQTTVDFVYSAFGYTLLQYCPLEKFFILKGESDTGKSTVLNVLTNMIGSINTRAISLNRLDKNNDRFGLRELYGKLANIHHDKSQYKLDGSGTLKLIVDGNEQNLEQKYGQQWTQKLFATLWGATNHNFESAELSDKGFANRLIIVPFDKRHYKVDPQVEQDLLQQDVLDGVFLKAFRALRQLLMRGHFVTSDAMDQAKLLNLAGDDNVKQFALKYLDTLVTVQHKTKGEVYARVELKDLYNLYKRVCLATEQQAKSDEEFNDSLEQWTGFKTRKARIWGKSSGSSNTIEGLVLNDDGYKLADELNTGITRHDTTS